MYDLYQLKVTIFNKKPWNSGAFYFVPIPTRPCRKSQFRARKIINSLTIKVGKTVIYTVDNTDIPMKKTSFLLFIFLLAVSAYRFPDYLPEGERGPFQISLPGADASGAYLTTDNNNNPVLSWVQQVSPDNYRMFYATSFDGGHTFEKAKWITTSKGIYPHDENLSKIIYRKNGDMMAIFAVQNPSKENKFAGLLYYTQSFDNGLVWTEPKQLSPAKSLSNDERYFDMTLLPDGKSV